MRRIANDAFETVAGWILGAVITVLAAIAGQRWKGDDEW